MKLSYNTSHGFPVGNVRLGRRFTLMEKMALRAGESIEEIILDSPPTQTRAQSYAELFEHLMRGE